MKRGLFVLALMGLLISPAMADLATQTATMGGDVRFMSQDTSPRSIPYDGLNEIYDNIPSAWGGGGVPAGYGTLEGSTGIRWNNGSPMGDDLHDLGVSSTFTHVHYGCIMYTGTYTHQISVYDMDPPSVTHGTTTTPVTRGPLIFQTTVAWISTSPSWYLLDVSALAPIHLQTGSVWIDLYDPTNATYWRMGQTPGTYGTSHEGLTIDLPTGFGGSSINWVPGPFGWTSGSVTTLIVAANLGVALGTPEPATIGLLALGGLALLRRRR